MQSKKGSASSTVSAVLLDVSLRHSASDQILIDQTQPTLYAIIAEGLTANKKDNEIIEEIQKALNDAPNKDEMLNFQEETTGDTALHLSIKRGNSALVDFLLRQEANQLTKDNDGKTAWHCAAELGEIEVLQKLWNWGMEHVDGQPRLNSIEIRDKLLLAKDNGGATAWHRAAEHGQLAVLEKLWELSETLSPPTGFKETLFFAKNHQGKTACHLAQHHEQQAALNTLWRFGQTLWHQAAQQCSSAALSNLWTLGKETLTSQLLKERLLLAEDQDGRTAWQLASTHGRIASLEKIQTWGEGVGLAPNEKERMMQKLPLTAELSSEDPKITEIFELLAQGDEKIELRESFKNITLLLGNTGSGKSTFTQWIAGDNAQLKAVRKGPDYIIEDGNRRIGSTTVKSKTTFPELVIDARNQVAYYDCPGFSDTRGEAHDIAVTYFIKKVIDHAESVKMVFIVNYPSVQIGVDRQDFMRLVRHTIAFIKEIDKFNHSIALIATKVNNQYEVNEEGALVLVGDDTVIHGVADFLSEVKQELSEALKNSQMTEPQRSFHQNAMGFINILLNKSVEHYSKIGLFRRPNKPGPLNEIPLLQKGKGHIESILSQQLEFTGINSTDFGYTVSDASKVFIHEVVLAIHQKVQAAVDRIADKIACYYANQVEDLQRSINDGLNNAGGFEIAPSRMEPLLTDFNSGYHHISSLLSAVEGLTTLPGLAEKLKSPLESLGGDQFTTEQELISQQEGYLQFFETINQGSLTTSPGEWSDRLAIVGSRLKSLQQTIEKIWFLDGEKSGKTLWLAAAANGQLSRLEALWPLGQRTLSSKEALFFAENPVGDNAWLLAAAHGKTNVLEKLWDWAQEALTEQPFKDRLLLVKGSNGQSAWHKAAENGQSAVLDKLWQWSQTGLTPAQRREQLFAKDAIWGSIWHLAALNGEVDVLEKIWGWCAELTPHAPQECQKQLLFDSNSDGNSAWHYAAWAEKIDVIDKLWAFAQASLTEEQRIQELLLKNKNDGNSALHWAAESGKVQSINKLWEIAQATLTPQQSKEAFFFARNNQGETACHIAEQNQQTEALHTLWQVGQVLWQRAAEQGNVNDLESLWALARETLSPQQRKDVLLVANDGTTSAWHRAAEGGQLASLEKLWVLAEEFEPQTKQQLFFVKNNQGLAAWLLALMHKRATTLNKLREWGRELLITPTAPERVRLTQVVNLLHPNATAVDTEGNDQAVFNILWLKKQDDSKQDNQQLIQQVGESIHRRIEASLKQIADALFDQYQQRIRSLETAELAQVFTEGIVLMSNLRSLSSMKQFIEQMASMQSTLSGLSTPIKESLFNCFNQLENLFFLQILTPENFQAKYASWSHPFTSIADYFAEEQEAVKGKHREIQCLDQPLVSNGTLVIRGEYIKLSDIVKDDKKLIIPCNNKPNKVNIFAANTIVIDRNLEAIGDQLQLAIIAPKWDVVGNRSIILDGMPGATHERTKANNGGSPGASGADGQPGLPGGPAGSFFGIGSHFIHSNQLTITANGGNGGPGQAGGDGAEGHKGADASSHNYNGRTHLDDDKIILLAFNWRDDFYHLHGFAGGVGGTGGKGGTGGLGGLSGQVNIVTLNEMDTPPLTMSTIGGSVGVDGHGGLGGMGGFGGRDVYASYEKKYFLWFRVARKMVSHRYINSPYDSSNPYTRAASGSNGIDGGYVTGRQSPEPAVVIENPAYIVNDYKEYLNKLIGQAHNFKKYALTQWVSRLLEGQYNNVHTPSTRRRKKREIPNTTLSVLKTKDRQHLITQLNTNEAVNGLYDTLGFLHELRGIEKQFYQLSQEQLGAAYQSLLTRISAYAGNTKEHETSSEYKKVLNYLYTATLSRSLAINFASERQLIIDIDGYLDVLKENIGKLRAFTQAVNQAQIRQNYNSGLDNSIKEAERFIKEEIIGAIDNVHRGLDEKIVTLVEEVITLQKQAEAEKAQLIQKKKELEETCGLRVMLGMVKKIGQALDYLGHVVPLARSVASGINKASTVAASLLLDGSTAQGKSLVLPAGIVNSVKLLDNPFRAKNNQNMTHFTQPMAGGVDIYSKFKTDQAGGDVISAQIQQMEEKINSLKQYEENIDKILKPMLEDIEEDLKQTTSGLAVKSQVALDVTQWQVQSHLRDVKLQLAQFAKGFKVEHEMTRFVEKLEESMTTLIQLYDRIQSYQAQQNLADYIANIHSPAAHLITINDRTLNEAVNELEQMIQTNVLLAQCQMAIDALKQWVFPFADSYLQSMLDPSESSAPLKASSNSTQISVDHAVVAIEKIRAKIKEYKMSIVRQDQYLHEGPFSSRYHSTEPFFVWENQPYQDTIARLLAGQKVLLKADILSSPADKQAIKFSRLEVNLKAINQTLQAEIDSKLKGFKVRATHLGNSYYRYNNRVYVITSDKQTLEFRFEKEPGSKDPLHKNKVYDKLTKGDLVLSPYAMWEIQLLNATRNADCKQLSIYKDEIDLELGGYANYVTGTEDDWKIDDYYTADNTLAIKAQQSSSKVRTRVKRAATNRHHRSHTTLGNSTIPMHRLSRLIAVTENIPAVSSGATSLNSWVTTLKNFCRSILSNYWGYQPVSETLNSSDVYLLRSTSYQEEPSDPLLGLTENHTSNGDAQAVTETDPEVASDPVNASVPIRPFHQPEESHRSEPSVFNDPFGTDELPMRPTTGPTLLEMGDQWVKNSDPNGLLTWVTLLARKWTGSRPKDSQMPYHDPTTAINLGIQPHELVDVFMDQVQKQAQACGIAKATAAAIFATPKLYTQAIETVRKKVATGQVDGVTALLFDQIVQQNFSKIAATTTSKQAGKLLAKVREALPKLEQQFLQQEVLLPNQSQGAEQANTISKVNIGLLKKAMCSMQPIDQLVDATSTLPVNNTMASVLVQNRLYHGNPYRKCANL